jgi:ABC-type nitrate/sulfonate/bicarbonate transport system substrate-binding protein
MKHSYYRIGLLGLAFLIIVSSVGATQALAAQPHQKVTLSYTAVSLTWLPLKVAVDKGFFAD